jgi:hypothetical protein
MIESSQCVRDKLRASIRLTDALPPLAVVVTVPAMTVTVPMTADMQIDARTVPISAIMTMGMAAVAMATMPPTTAGYLLGCGC